MRITEDQQQFVNSLKCERLSSNSEHIRTVDTFYNRKNDALVDVLRNQAFAEDESGSTAYYLIKDKDNHILFFFSLRCGLLYDEFIEGEQLRSLNLLYTKLAENLSDVHLSEDKRKQVALLMEGLRSKKGIQRQTVTDVLGSNHIDIDINKLFSKHQLSVGKSFSGVELMHFCANDEYHDSWALKGIKPLGAVVFWQFVVPIVLDIIKLVGCEYLFLFAADLTEDELLVRYYNDYLGFTEKTEHHVAMPLYDLACKFMYQDTKDLMNRKNVFFDNFNPDEDAV